MSILRAALIAGICSCALAQQKPAVSEQEQGISRQLRTLRKLPDDERARTTKLLAIQIRQLPATGNKAGLAYELANLATEGDFGHDTLQEVATTLADTLREQPGRAAEPYVELAKLVRYEHMQASLDHPQFAAAVAKLEADDQRRAEVDFTLTDLHGKSWTLRELRGKVLLVNFWATWCPPCRKEMPDLDALYKRFREQGLLILAISEEPADTVGAFVNAQKVSYPVLLDPGGKVKALFAVVGIPQSFVYDRDGKLVAQAIDMRTEKQFLEMLGRAGLR